MFFGRVCFVLKNSIRLILLSVWSCFRMLAVILVSGVFFTEHLGFESTLKKKALLISKYVKKTNKSPATQLAPYLSKRWWVELDSSTQSQHWSVLHRRWSPPWDWAQSPDHSHSHHTFCHLQLHSHQKLYNVIVTLSNSTLVWVPPTPPKKNPPPSPILFTHCLFYNTGKHHQRLDYANGESEKEQYTTMQPPPPTHTHNPAFAAVQCYI